MHLLVIVAIFYSQEAGAPVIGQLLQNEVGTLLYVSVNRLHDGTYGWKEDTLPCFK